MRKERDISAGTFMPSDRDLEPLVP
jgi:hypothetical protein